MRRPPVSEPDRGAEAKSLRKVVPRSSHGVPDRAPPPLAGWELPRGRGRLAEPERAALFNQGDGQGGMALQIDPGEDTRLLRQALASRWHYAVTRAGTIIRDLPAKPSHPWEDLGDGFCYLIGGIAPSHDWDAVRERHKTQRYAKTNLSFLDADRRERRALGSIGPE